MPEGSAGHIQIVATMEGDAQKKVQSLSQSLKKNLGQSFKSAALSMISFTAVLSTVGLSLTGLVVLFKNWVTEVRNSNRSLSLMETRMQTAGFSADRTAEAMERLRNNLSRTAIAALPGLTASTQEFIESLSGSGLRDFESDARKLAEVLGIKLPQAQELLAQAHLGNTAELKKLWRGFDETRDISEQVQRAFDNMRENESKLDKFFREVGEDAIGLKDALLALVEIGLGTTWSDAIKEFFTSGTITEDAEAMLETAGKWGLMLVTGFAEWLLGETAVKAISEALKGNWAAAWLILKEPVTQWGKDIFTSLTEGAKDWLQANLYGWLTDHVLDPIKNWIDRKMTEIGDIGSQVGSGLVAGMIRGIDETMGGLLSAAVRWLNRIIGVINQGRSKLGMSSIDDVRLPGGPTGPVPIAVPRPTNPPKDPIQQTLSIQMSGREVAKAVIEVMNDQVRVREPGLGMG